MAEHRNELNKSDLTNMLEMLREDSPENYKKIAAKIANGSEVTVAKEALNETEMAAAEVALNIVTKRHVRDTDLGELSREFLDIPAGKSDVWGAVPPKEEVEPYVDAAQIRASEASDPANRGGNRLSQEDLEKAATAAAPENRASIRSHADKVKNPDSHWALPSEGGNNKGREGR
jgi:hypothetical protein